MASGEDHWQKIRLVSTRNHKDVKDMTAKVPLSWNGEKISNFYRTFHKQNGEVNFPKAFNLLLFGKSLTMETKISDITQGRVLANEIKIYVLPDQNAQGSSAARADSNFLKNLTSAEQEAVNIVEANQTFSLLSEYIGSLLAAYDPLSQAETKQIILKNFPLMDPKIQAMILKCSKFYGSTYDNPFVDENITKLMDALDIQPQQRDRQAVHDLFKRSIEQHERREREPAQEPAARENQEDAQAQRPQINQFIQEIEAQLNRQQRDRPNVVDPQVNRYLFLI